ncbi:MAG: hypothetical protein WEE89_22485 [Gemmatimonadota bacterium]
MKSSGASVCGALVNYDMPWNPMRVEQRIGRIDRLGQEHKEVRIINLHYRNTVEADVYQALRGRIQLFEHVVGRLQPILSQLSARISKVVLSETSVERERAREEVVNSIEGEVEEYRAHGFDLDEYAWVDLPLDERAPAPLDLDFLDRVIRRKDLLPPGADAKPLQAIEYSYSVPGFSAPVRVTTNAEYYEQNPESVELWSPGSPLFPRPEVPELPVSLSAVHAIVRLSKADRQPPSPTA